MKKNTVERHFDKVAKSYDPGKTKYSYYYENLKILLGSLIPKEQKVLEVGCGTGDLLVSLNPKYGYGMDISPQMINIATVKYGEEKSLKFSTILPSDNFEYIFMSDVIEHLEKPLDTFNQIAKLMDKNSKFVITMANPIWEPLLLIWERLGWKMKEGPHKRIRYKDIMILSEKAEMKVVKHDYKLLLPIKIPFITEFANKYLEKVFKKLCFIEYFSIIKSL